MTSILKVDTIQNSTGTDALSIDSSGRVTNTTKPAFRVYNIATGSSFKTGHLTYTNVELNQGGHWDNTNSVFIVPVSGIYLLSTTNLLCRSDSTSPLASGASGSAFIEVSRDSGVSWPTDSVGLRVNRIGCAYGYAEGGIHHPNGNSTVTAYLDVGDYVRVHTPVGSYYDSTPFSTFSGHLIG